MFCHALYYTTFRYTALGYVNIDVATQATIQACPVSPILYSNPVSPVMYLIFDKGIVKGV